MSDRIAALQLFVRTAHTGSFSRAGRDLGVIQPVVSRTIAKLERELGIALFTRTTRAVVLTDAGREFLGRVEPILLQLEEAYHTIGGESELRGVLRVGVSSSFAIREIIPRLPIFLERHPSLRLELLVSDQRQDLVLEGVDVAIRLGPMPDSSALARQLGRWQRILVASPDYLEKMGVPETPTDLTRHQIIGGPSTSAQAWSFRNDGRRLSIKLDTRIAVTLNEAAIAAAVAGIGIASTGVTGSRSELRGGTLVQVLPDWQMEPIEVHAVYAGGRAAKSAARIFTDFLASELHGSYADP